MLSDQNDTQGQKQQKKKPTFLHLFWLTIVLLFFFYGALQVAKFIRHSVQSVEKSKPPILSLTVGNFLKENLENNESRKKIADALSMELSDLNQTIDIKIDALFQPIEANIDSFLDFHYSVKGEYTELIVSAAGKIEEEVQRRLLGDDISKRFAETKDAIDKKYKSTIASHTELVTGIATKNIDSEINDEILNQLKEDIKVRENSQLAKIGGIAGIKLAATLMTKLSAKLAAKAATKTAVKTGTKLAAKAASAGTAAAGGTLCGPAVVICAPLAAIVAWVATDAAIVSADEYINRDEFKAKILHDITMQKTELKKELQDAYTSSFIQYHKALITNLEATKVKKRVTVKERIHHSENK